MIEKVKTYALLIETVAILVLSGILYRGCQADRTGSVLPADSTISAVTVTVYVPLQGQNKEQLREQKAIPKEVAEDPDKEVLTSTVIKDESGSRNIAAVLNTKTGKPELIEKRPIAETMRRFELGIGAGLESGDPARALQARVTLGRLDSIYFTGQVEYFDVDRTEHPHPWNALAFLHLRF